MSLKRSQFLNCLHFSCSVTMTTPVGNIRASCLSPEVLDPVFHHNRLHSGQILLVLSTFPSAAAAKNKHE